MLLGSTLLGSTLLGSTLLGSTLLGSTKVLALLCGLGKAVTARNQPYFMKHQNRTAQMVDQIIEPAVRQAAKQTRSLGFAASSACTHSQTHPQTQCRHPRYRVDKVIDQAIGKRTLLATDINSQAKVVLKLVLFSPNLLEEEKEQRIFQQDALTTRELPANVPYLDSFEVKTLLGEGLVLVKPYVETSKIKTREAIAPAPPRCSVTTFTYSAFKVRPAQQKFEIQLPAARIKEGLVFDTAATTPTQSLEHWLSVILSTVIFVGGTVVLTGSVLWGIAVAALLPLLFRPLAAPRNSHHTAIIRLTPGSSGRTFLSLTTSTPAIRYRNGKISHAPKESTLHCSNLSIESVEASSTLALMPGYNPLMAQLSFSFHNFAHRRTRIRIVGSCEEIRWISHHLAQWGNQQAKPTREVTK